GGGRGVGGGPAGTRGSRTAAGARDEAAGAAVGAQRVLADEAGRARHLRRGTVRGRGIDAERACRTRIAEIAAAALAEEIAEALARGARRHDPPPVGVTTRPMPP